MRLRPSPFSVVRAVVNSLNVCVAFTLVFVLGGCGGGTSGTGLTTFYGNLKSETGAPLNHVQVTISDTGDSDETNEKGQFKIVSPASGSDITLLLDSETIHSRVKVPAVPEESSRVTLNLVVDSETKVINVTNFSLRAGFVGLCDDYFENNSVIRQANEVPFGTICTLHAILEGDGKLRSNIPVALQYKSCAFGSPWKTLDATKTRAGADLGTATLTFPFIDSREFCVYRVVAPFQYGDYEPVIYPIISFSAQAAGIDTEAR